MKTALLLLALATTLVVQAQDAIIEQQPPKSATEAMRTEQQRQEAERQRAERLLNQKPVITYGGFIKEFREVPDKKKFFSLRRPVEPEKDYKNILYDPQTARPKGFIFFSLSF